VIEQNPIPDFLLVSKCQGQKLAFIKNDQVTTYDDWLARIGELGNRIRKNKIDAGAVVILYGDLSAEAAAWLMALWIEGAIVAPLIPDQSERLMQYGKVASAEWIVDVQSGEIQRGPGGLRHHLAQELAAKAVPGLIIFSSGTTGEPKAALHDLRRLLLKFSKPGRAFTTLAFLLFDHIAGIDTLLYCLANGATIVCPNQRSPECIAKLIAKHRVEVIPTAPSFLNLMLLSGAAKKHEMSCLKIITYGAEMMPQWLLERLVETFPKIEIIQKYGTSEVGAPRTRSEAKTSRWINFGIEGQDWRVVDSKLELPGDKAMLGYLNAPSPFSTDGWYRTGDLVERKGTMLRILGRDTDLINVGGEKVFPAEIESLLCQIEGVDEAMVFGASHAILGTAVYARVRTSNSEVSATLVRIRIREALCGKLEAFKIPQKIEVVRSSLYTDRFKLERR